MIKHSTMEIPFYADSNEMGGKKQQQPIRL